MMEEGNDFGGGGITTAGGKIALIAFESRARAFGASGQARSVYTLVTASQEDPPNVKKKSNFS